MIDGFSFPKWIAARKCWQAADRETDKIAERSLRAASRKLLNGAWIDDGPHDGPPTRKNAT